MNAGSLRFAGGPDPAFFLAGRVAKMNAGSLRFGAVGLNRRSFWPGGWR
jgi:hypothetical protein